MEKQKFIILFLLLTFSASVYCQSAKADKEQAKAYIAANHYEDALNVLKSNKQLSRKDEEARFLMAVCLFQINDLAHSKSVFESLIDEEKSPYPECWFYLGKIFHAQQQFPEAIQQYKTYLRLLRPEHPNRAMVIQEIKRCDNGLRLNFREAQTIVENLGEKVNTTGDEFAPVLSPNRSTQLYFSAIKQGNTGGARNANTSIDEHYGQHLSDMFSSRLSGGQWQSPQALHYLLNTPQHEQLIGFSNHGEVLLYYKGWTWENGEIFADTFQHDAQRSLKTTTFNAPASGNAGEHNLFLYNDTLLIFASRKAGGYGGFDLYRSVRKNHYWSAPQNMGPTINSAFDETTPYLSRDGSTLYFSTNDSQRSVGGLDIVRSVYIKEAKRWSGAENLGFPVNSPSDDAHFILAKDGFTAFFSSARKDGFGQRDLYIAYFTKYRKEMDLPEVVSTSPTLNTSSQPLIHPGKIQSPTTDWGSPGGVQPSRPNATPQPTTPRPSSVHPIKIVAVTPPPVSHTEKQWVSMASSNLFDINTQAWVNNLIREAKRQAQSHIVLTCYLPIQHGETKSKTLFDGIKYLQGFNQQLSRQGIAPSRVFLRSLVSLNGQFVLSANMVSTQNNSNNQWPVINDEGDYNLPPSTVNRALVYKVQVMSVQRSLDNQQLSSLDFLMLENAAALPHLRYTAGAVATYQEAKSLRQQLINNGFNGAFVIPYLYGERIDKAKAKLFSSEYPDLLRYLGR